MADARAEFIRAYSKLPISTREEVIVVIDGKPITWDVAYLEVSANTTLGKRIIEKLTKMEILGGD